MNLIINIECKIFVMIHQLFIKINYMYLLKIFFINIKLEISSNKYVI